MEINNALDKLIAHRQGACDHLYQDRVVSPDKIFCGKCGRKEK